MLRSVHAGKEHPSALVRESQRLAAVKHAGQERKATAIPYVDHVGEVAALLADVGFDDEVIAAALLHDVVEHTDIELDDVRAGFGERVGEMVGAMTDRDEIEPWEERKAEHRDRVAAAGRDVAAIYAADKICGVREARAGYAELGEAVAERLGNSLDARIGSWEADLEMLDRMEPPLPFLPVLSLELDGLRADRMARAGA